MFVYLAIKNKIRKLIYSFVMIYFKFYICYCRISRIPMSVLLIARN